jgi:hypothetical protein
LESYGLKVRVQGCGKVVRQSYAPGRTIVDNAECVLTLQ